MENSIIGLAQLSKICEKNIPKTSSWTSDVHIIYMLQTIPLDYIRLQIVCMMVCQKCDTQQVKVSSQDHHQFLRHGSKYVWLVAVHLAKRPFTQVICENYCEQFLECIPTSAHILHGSKHTEMIT